MSPWVGRHNLKEDRSQKTDDIGKGFQIVLIITAQLPTRDQMSVFRYEGLDLYFLTFPPIICPLSSVICLLSSVICFFSNSLNLIYFKNFP